VPGPPTKGRSNGSWPLLTHHQSMPCNITRCCLINLLVRHGVPSQQQCPAAQSRAVVVPPLPAAVVSPVPGEVDKVPSRAASAALLSAAVEPASLGLHDSTKQTTDAALTRVCQKINYNLIVLNNTPVASNSNADQFITLSLLYCNIL